MARTAAAPVRAPLARGIARHPLVAFVALAYAVSWAFWGLATLAGTDTLPGAVAFVAGGFGPGAAALIVLGSGAGSVRRWAAAIVRWRVPARYWAYALGLPALLYVAANLLLIVFGEEVAWGLIVFGEEVAYLAGLVVLLVATRGRLGFDPKANGRYVP